MDPPEPVIYVHVGNETRAYPLQILIWHEIVNDRIGRMPIAVTFCPLCHSALVFDRRLAGRVLTLGVSGYLRNSDMVMYDHQTGSVWTMTGRAVAGPLTHTQLAPIPHGDYFAFAFLAFYPEADVYTSRMNSR